MPAISMFYGILMGVFFKDVERHHAPHVHAEHEAR